MKTAYLIKATHLDGPHKDKTYLMRKGTYIHPDNWNYDFIEYCYKTKGFALRECRRLKEQNDIDVEYYDAEEKRKDKPVDAYNRIYRESYEPYEIELVELKTKL